MKLAVYVTIGMLIARALEYLGLAAFTWVRMRQAKKAYDKKRDVIASLAQAAFERRAAEDKEAVTTAAVEDEDWVELD